MLGIVSLIAVVVIVLAMGLLFFYYRPGKKKEEDDLSLIPYKEEENHEPEKKSTLWSVTINLWVSVIVDLLPTVLLILLTLIIISLVVLLFMNYGMAVLLVLFGTVSISLTALILLATLAVLLVKPPENSGDDPKGIWQILGFIPDTPNIIRAVVAGWDEKNGPIVQYILPDATYNTETKEIDDITNPYSDETSFDRWVRVRFGMRHFGKPFISSLRPLSIDRVVTVDSQTSNTSSELVKQLKGSVVKKYGLYRQIYRPTLHRDLDTKDGIRFSVISYAIIRVFDPSQAFTIYKDNFLQTLSELIGGFLSEEIITTDWEVYKQSGKDFDPNDIAKLNEKLKILGVTLITLTMSDPELNPKVQETMEKRVTAKEAAKATVITAHGEKRATIARAEGQAQATERLAKANRRRFEELVEMYTTQGVPAADAAAMAKETIKNSQDAEAIGKLRTFVAGGSGVQIGVDKEE